VSDQPQPTKKQVTDVIMNAIVSVDVHDNAVILSAYRLISYFVKDAQDIEKIIKVDINENSELVVYASARPKNQFIKSLIVKAVLTNDILSMLKMRYELIKDKNDVLIKLYLGTNQLQNISLTNTTEDVDF
jgi:hypothetical protein